MNNVPKEPFPKVGDEVEYQPPKITGRLEPVRTTVRRVDWPVLWLKNPPPFDAVYPRACIFFRWRSPGTEAWVEYPVTKQVDECVVCGREFEVKPGHSPRDKQTCGKACSRTLYNISERLRKRAGK